VADIIDISIPNDISLELWQRPFRERQSKICWLGQSYVNYGLALLIAEFWIAATVPVFGFEDLKSHFIESMYDIALSKPTESWIAVHGMVSAKAQGILSLGILISIISARDYQENPSRKWNQVQKNQNLERI